MRILYRAHLADNLTVGDTHLRLDLLLDKAGVIRRIEACD